MSFESYIPMVTGKGIWAVVDNRVFFARKVELYCLTTLNDISAQKKALQDLQASHDSVKSIFDDVNDLVQSIGPDGQILYANQKWLHTLGYEESELASFKPCEYFKS